MRKVLLIAIALCCVGVGMAQKSYTQKLDSLVVNNGSRVLQFTYNENYDYSQMVELFYGALLSTTTFDYDTQKHLICVTHLEPGSDYKIEYTYNEQGWVAEENYFDRETTWIPSVKTLFEYDSNGNILKKTEQFYSEGEALVNFELHEYHYDNGRLMDIVTYYWEAAYNNWEVYSKDVYTYNSEGDCTETNSYRPDDNGWVPYYQIVNEYDHKHNCVKQSEYEINAENEPVLIFVAAYTYDLDIAIDVIAGLGVLTDNNDFPVYNKPTKVEETSYSGSGGSQSTLYDFFYSDCSGVADNPMHSMALWPNPANQVLNLDADDLTQVEIYSMDGKLVKCFQNGFERLNVSGLTKGGYLLKAIMSDGSVATQKFLKE